MNETMMEVLHKRRLIKVANSIRMIESNEQQLQNKAEAAKEQLGNLTGIDEDAAYIAQLSHQYYIMKACYQGKSLYTKVVDSEKRRMLWSRVQACCKKADVSPEHFMKAQFDYFHRAFGTTPKLSHLATPNAVYRALAFEGKTIGKVVGNAIEFKLDLGALFSHCEKQIRDVCRAQGIDRAAYYKIFVVTGLMPMDTHFLSKDPVYQEVANGTCSIST